MEGETGRKKKAKEKKKNKREEEKNEKFLESPIHEYIVVDWQVNSSA